MKAAEIIAGRHGIAQCIDRNGTRFFVVTTSPRFDMVKYQAFLVRQYQQFVKMPSKTSFCLLQCLPNTNGWKMPSITRFARIKKLSDDQYWNYINIRKAAKARRIVTKTISVQEYFLLIKKWCLDEVESINDFEQKITYLNKRKRLVERLVIWYNIEAEAAATLKDLEQWITYYNLESELKIRSLSFGRGKTQIQESQTIPVQKFKSEDFALMHCYLSMFDKGAHIDRSNMDEVADRYGFGSKCSGQALYQDYNKYNKNVSERKGLRQSKPADTKHKQRLERVIELLNSHPKALARATDEYNSFLNDYEAEYPSKKVTKNKKSNRV
jgi:hypothetical protein